jgi:hypothetical protein
MARKPKQGSVPPPRDDDGEITTVKVYRRLARTITQLAKFRNKNQQDLLEEYRKKFEDDLFAAMANRQAEIREDRQE